MTATATTTKEVLPQTHDSTREGSLQETPFEKANQLDASPRTSSEIDEKAAATAQPPDLAQVESKTEYPSFKRLLPVLCSIYLAFFLIALDKTIIGTAVPAITNEFHSLKDIGWYGSAYVFTTAATQLIFGKIYQFYPPKTVYLSCIFLFEVGSAICGSAPTSGALIAGRAIAGVGAAGMQNGSLTIFIHVIPLNKQPVFQGLMGSVFGIASVIGPLLGGVFTDHLSWRWCFYINLPIGGIAFFVILFILKIELPRKGPALTLSQKLVKLDPIGNLFFIPGIVCVLLALQWGGSTYAWSSGRIIALLVIGPILLIIFIGTQLWLQENAMVPPRIIRQRSVAAGTLFSFCIGGMLLVIGFYLPLWFQAIKGVSAQKSGIMNIPMILSMVVASLLGGGLIKKLGYYAPFMIATSVFTAIAGGLLSTFEPDTGHAKWIGYQFIFGFGLGLGMQQSVTAVRATLSKMDAMIGVAVTFFVMTLGQSIFVAVAQPIFSSVFRSGLDAIPGIDPALIVSTGATEFRNIVPADLLPAVLSAYNDAVTSVFYILAALGSLSIVGSLSIEWRSIKEEKKPEAPEGKESA